MADSLAQSYYKPWRKRWWGKLLFALLLLILVGVILFGALVANYYKHRTEGHIYVAATGEWLTAEEFKENRKIIGELLTGDDPWLGAEDPIIYIVSYDSFGCPFCKEAEADIKRMLADYGEVVKFIVKDYPTEGTHPGVLDAHLAAGCANEQNSYWEYRDVLFEKQRDFKPYELKEWAADLGLNEAQFKKCYDEGKYNNEIRQDYSDGVQTGVVGTPSYLVNGTLIQGRVPYDDWVKAIAYLLQQEL